MSAVRAFLSRPAAERRIVLRTMAGALVAKVSLRIRGFGPTRRLFDRMSSGTLGAAGETLATARLAHRVMTRLPIRLTCLERSLVVFWLSGGDPHARIRFGVQPADAGTTPSFHAWVEVGDMVLDDGVEDISTFLPLTAPEPPQLGRFD